MLFAQLLTQLLNDWARGRKAIERGQVLLGLRDVRGPEFLFVILSCDPRIYLSHESLKEEAQEHIVGKLFALLESSAQQIQIDVAEETLLTLHRPGREMS